MEVRQSIHSAHAKTLDTQGLRNEFLVEKVFVDEVYTLVYSHIDRIFVGGIKPIAGADVWIANPESPEDPYRLLLLCRSRAKVAI